MKKMFFDKEYKGIDAGRMQGGARAAVMFLAAALIFFACVSCTAKPGEIQAPSITATEQTKPQTYVDVEDENANPWAQSVFDESLQQLVSQGDIEAYQEGYLFAYTKNESSYNMMFLKDEAARRYSEAPASIQGKAVLGYWESRNGFSVYQKGKPNPTLPTYMPTWSESDLPLLEGPDPDVFANSIQECDFLIIFGGFETSRSKNYYMTGSDRVVTTTLVFIFDAREKQLLHVESIGTDDPGATTTMGHTTGRTLHAQAQAYIIALLSA